MGEERKAWLLLTLRWLVRDLTEVAKALERGGVEETVRIQLVEEADRLSSLANRIIVREPAS